MKIEELKLTNKRYKLCKALNFENSFDILSYYPYKFEINNLLSFSNFSTNKTICFKSKVLTKPIINRYSSKSRINFQVEIEGKILNIILFNRKFLPSIEVGQDIVIVGKYDGLNKVICLNYSTDESKLVGVCRTYSTKEDFKQYEFVNLIKFVYEKVKDELKEEIPRDFLNKHDLIGYKRSIHAIHFSKDEIEVKKAISYLKYHEILKFMVSSKLLYKQNAIVKKPKIFDDNIIKTFILNLKFELTLDQQSALNDILNDLRSTSLCHRLIQGDVGCGKTVVCAIGLYANYLSGYQGALMVPTEILAYQHFVSLKSFFKDLNLKIECLTSSSINQNDIKERLKNGDIDIIVGTHSLYSESVEYKNLGLCIADEQHRFGVNQRKALRLKGENVDTILMSATPIPRTLATTLYADMDVSTIETMPNNRKGCMSYFIKENSIKSIIYDIKKHIKSNKQVYIIASAIEEGSNIKRKNVVSLYENLKDMFLPYKVGLLHGKMDQNSKEEILNQFEHNRISILISTTVVEVGVNIENATMMIIYDSDRFGLAQLHQLRGRIQRGSDVGKCYFLTSNLNDETISKLDFVSKNNDGFIISKFDLAFRGPGDIIGTKQSGLPSLHIADIINDTKFIEASKIDCEMILNDINNSKYKCLIDVIIKDLKSFSYN